MEVKGIIIQVSDFRHIPGKNDAEYIKLLKEALERQKQITSKAIAKIKELSNCSEFPNNWIPCSERLPDESNFYMVTNEYDEVEIIWFAHKDDYDIDKSEWRETKDKIVAWMPLPPCYRGNENDK